MRPLMDHTFQFLQTNGPQIPFFADSGDEERYLPPFVTVGHHLFGQGLQAFVAEQGARFFQERGVEIAETAAAGPPVFKDNMDHHDLMGEMIRIPAEFRPGGHLVAEISDAADPHEGQRDAQHVKAGLFNSGLDRALHVHVRLDAGDVELKPGRCKRAFHRPGNLQGAFIQPGDLRVVDITYQVVCPVFADDIDEMGVEVGPGVGREVLHIEKVHLHGHRNPLIEKAVQGSHGLVRGPVFLTADLNTESFLHGCTDLARLIAEDKGRKIQGGELEIPKKKAAGDTENHGFGDGEARMIQLGCNGA